MKDYREYLKPDVVAGLSGIELKARMVVEGFITGLHRSPYHGFSIEFAEHRAYRPGDETKNIDWKVFARTNRFYVKQFEEETNLRGMIAIDTSASMNYSSKGSISKFEYAVYLAAALAMLMNRQRDAVGLATYDTEVRTLMPPNSKPSYIGTILKTLAEIKPSNETSTAAALDELAERIHRRGLVIIISDFFDRQKSVLDALKHFRHRNHEVAAFQILDKREIDFDFGQPANFKDMETGEEMITRPYQVKKAYEKEVKAYSEEIKKECFNHNIDYFLIDTSTPFDVALKNYLIKRRKV